MSIAVMSEEMRRPLGKVEWNSRRPNILPEAYVDEPLLLLMCSRRVALCGSGKHGIGIYQAARR